jgi:hypothetical protein
LTVFFTDRDLGTRFPDILAAAGLTVERHQNHFRQDCPDEEWLQAIGRKEWVAITHDTRIRYKPNERDAVIRNRVKLLVVIGKAPFAELALNFVNTLPKIDRFLARNEAPLIAKVYRPSPGQLAANSGAMGDVSRWYP